jgi:2'-5' RNA ligase
MAHATTVLVVVATPEPLPASVDRARWPAHVTVAANFRVDEALVDAVAELVAECAAGARPVTVRLGPRAAFGADGTIPVLLASHEAFESWHRSLARALADVPSFRPADPQFWSAGYRPHVTLAPGVTVRDGQDLTITELALFSLEGSTGRRLATWPLAAEVAPPSRH